MIKRMFITSSFLILSISFWNCDRILNDNEKGSQAALVFVQHYYTGRRAPDWVRVKIPSIWANAEITGDPLPEIKEIGIAGIEFNSTDHFHYDQGIVYFSSENRIWADSVAEPKFDPLRIKISTDLGEITGSITVPDTIRTLAIDAADTIPPGTPVTISWSGSNAGYYLVCFFHNWMEDEGYLLGYSRDTCVTGNSVTFPGSRFTKDGDLSEIEIYPMNGPLPEPGARPNMGGDGFGYLYLENKAIRSERFVVIGEGIDYSLFAKRSTPAFRAESRPMSSRQRIKSRLGL